MEPTSCPKYEDYRGVMIDIALEDTSLDEPALVDEVRRHIRVCPHCQSEFDAYRRVVTLFTPPPVPEEEIEEIAENVRRRVLAKVYTYERRRRFVRWSAVAACLAAVAVVVIGIAPLLSGRASKPAPTCQAPETKAPPSVSPTGGLQAVVIPASKEQSTPVMLTSKPTTPEQRAKLEEAKRLREEGSRHVRARDYEKAGPPLRRAIQSLDGLLAYRPGAEATTAALYEKYRCYQLLGEYLDREACLKAYLDMVRREDGDEGVVRALLADAQGLINEDQLESGCRALEQVLVHRLHGPLAFATHTLMGLAAERQDLTDLACSQYGMALSAHYSPELAEHICKIMIQRFLQERRYDEAIREADKLVELRKDELPAQELVHRARVLAELHAYKGDIPMAIQVLRRAIKHCATGADGYIAEAQMQQLLMDYACRHKGAFE